uniref:EGF-like domain-containing protein n=1 Tax=Accipiter nisus TaxID=211598 RepID=A0A8B9MBH2_9AVES
MSPCVTCRLSPVRISEACPEGLFGARCEEPCDCGDNVSCHHVTGACDCPRGWRGRRCEKGETASLRRRSTYCSLLGFFPTACLPGSFGKNCASRCACPLGVPCDHITGRCGCPPGFTGSGCEKLLGFLFNPCLFLESRNHLRAGAFAFWVAENSHFALVPSLLTACLPGTFGEDCGQICQCAGATQECHPVTGACVCAPGFHGPTCQLECSPGWYGRNCEMPCKCKNGGLCDTTTGMCHCPAGYIGADCSIGECPGQPEGMRARGTCALVEPRQLKVFLPPGCPAGRYGKDCARACSCGEGATCHPVTGDCVCPPGKAGPTCEHLWRWAGKFLCLGRSCPNHGTVCAPAATASCPAGCEKHRYGVGCQQTCSCRNGGLCDAADGSCLCALGWTGKSCELGKPGLDALPYAGPVTVELARSGSHWVRFLLPHLRPFCLSRHGPLKRRSGAGAGSPAAEQLRRRLFPAECPPGRYGADCQLRCACLHNATCDPGTGACRCSAGRYGPLCEHSELRRQKHLWLRDAGVVF